MSAQAWVRRGRTKRIRMALKAAIKLFERDPWTVVPLHEFDLVIMSPVYYADLMTNLRLLEQWTDEMRSTGDG